MAGTIIGACLQPAVLGVFRQIAGRGGDSETAQSTTKEAPVSAAAEPLDVVALGRLLPLGDIVALALPSGAGDARVARLLVAEGERVEAGQVIAERDNLPQLLAQKSSAESELAAQQATLEQARAAMLASYREARANQTRAEAALMLAKQELARMTKLSEKT
nr:biotin/lipoyl-binding protein [Marinicella sp. W31]MDC2875565.1 biotin/lipoyl-binding protein [Marinicella sp. W31]